MDVNRIETKPACLAALAVMALGLSVLVLNARHEHEASSRLVESPDRPQRALQWPMLSLSQLPVDAPLAEENISRTSAASTSLLNSFVSEPPRLSFGAQKDWSLLLDLPTGDQEWPAATLNPIEKVLRQYSINQNSSAEVTTGSVTEMVMLIPAPPLMTAAQPTLATREPELWEEPTYSPYTLNASFMQSSVREMARRALRQATDLNRVASILVDRKESAELIGPKFSSPNKPSLEDLKSDTQIGASLLTRKMPADEASQVLPTPTALSNQLSRLTEYDSTCSWAWDAAYRLRGLASATVNDTDEIARSLSALNYLVKQTDKILVQEEERSVEVELIRAKHALERRIATWSVVMNSAQQLNEEATPEQRREELIADARWAMTPNAWAMPRKAAPPAKSVDSRSVQIVHRLEDYEESSSSAEAREIVKQIRQISREGGQSSADLVQAVEQHYRNANVRVAVSQDLVNRLLPRPMPEVRRVNDRIAGAPVQGKSTTNTQLRVRVMPDPNVLRFGFEARGVVSSRTVSNGGPAILHSRGATNFYVSKQIMVTNQGINANAAKAKALSDSQLIGLSTKLDRMPLLGSYVRSKARQEYVRLRGRARSEVEQKVSNQIAQVINVKAEEGLERIEQRYQKEVLERAKNLGVEVTPIEMRTTDSRWITRLRVAGPDQLAAHTPRMRAPSDSLLSLQMHESAINNVIEGIGLDGKRLSTNELRDHFVETLVLNPSEEETQSEKALLHFADKDAASIVFEEGRMKLTLALREMIARGSRHRNFKVHVYYRPEVYGTKALLVQEGTPHVEGRMRTAQRLRLHGALGKVLGEDRRIEIVKSPVDFAPKHAEKLAGLAPTQFVIEDGWLGLAIGPQQTKHMVRRVGSYVR